MPFELYRIDDRLIHGQVVVGWGQPLDIAFIVLVDDAVAASDWEQELYRMGVPPEMEVSFASVEAALAGLGLAGKARARHPADRRRGDDAAGGRGRRGSGAGGKRRGHSSQARA